MQEILRLIQGRQSSRVPYDVEKKISKTDLEQIIEAARWAPTAHNMQNYEIIVVDDKKILEAIANIKSPMSPIFVRENYQQLSFSEDELRKKKVGLLGTMFPPALRNPETKVDTNTIEQMASFQSQLIQTSPVLLILLYDPGKRAPASQGDFLGIVSLGCVMENMWLMAYTLGIAFHVVSALSAYPTEDEVKKILHIPSNLNIAYSARLGYPVRPIQYLRVRRDIRDFAHHNGFENRGLD